MSCSSMHHVDCECNISIENIPTTTQFQNSDQLVVGEESELKPCPFCGERPFNICWPNTTMHCQALLVSIETWNNAWAHKQIAALEARNAELCSMLDKYSGIEDKLFLCEQKLKTAEEELKMERLINIKNWYQFQLDRKELQQKITAREKSEQIEIDKRLEMEAKLKTCEDALAAVTKEKEEIRHQLNRESL